MIVTSLPSLPTSLRYLDEYDDDIKCIDNPDNNDTWCVTSDTRTYTIDFGVIEDPDEKKLLKASAYWILSTLSVSVSVRRISSLIRGSEIFGGRWLLQALERPVSAWTLYWETEIWDKNDEGILISTKTFLYFLCEMEVAGWSPSYEPIIQSLRYKRRRSYLGVKSGDAILSVKEEGMIVAWLDEQSDRVSRNKESLNDEELIGFCILCVSYAHALRPVQIARINLSDLRMYTGDEGEVVIHFTAYRAKKRDVKEKIPFNRKISRRWAAPFAAWLERRHADTEEIGNRSSSSIKAFNIPIDKMTRTIMAITEDITGVRRGATDLRHSAAQRLVDAGANVEEVAEFLGHSHWDTSLIYFDASDAQAALINKALAISPIYTRIVEVAQSGFIDRGALESAPYDQQIGAVPHGIAITGIGACRTGQSLCTLNPAMSCYTCRKFIPINEADAHRQALSDFREVVNLFYGEARSESRSPAFVQLRRTLEAIQAVIAELEQPLHGAQT